VLFTARKTQEVPDNVKLFDHFLPILSLKDLYYRFLVNFCLDHVVECVDVHASVAFLIRFDIMQVRKSEESLLRFTENSLLGNTQIACLLVKAHCMQLARVEKSNSKGYKPKSDKVLPPKAFPIAMKKNPKRTQRYMVK